MKNWSIIYIKSRVNQKLVNHLILYHLNLNMNSIESGKKVELDLAHWKFLTHKHKMKTSFQISIHRIKIMCKRWTYILEKLLGILQLISFTSWWSSVQENKKGDPSTTP